MKKISMDELNRVSVDEYKKIIKNPVAILLDDVRSLNNVGSAFRTGDAFLISKIYLTGITGTPPNREIQKTALGATESVDWEYAKSPVEVVEKLKLEGYKIICIEQASPSVMLDKFNPDANEKYLFIFGNEVFGVNDAVLEKADVCVEIPQYGTKHSLNISVTIGIVLWDYMLKTKPTS